MNSTNKVAIITGASKGIGKAIAVGLGKMKYQTILIGRNQEDLKKVADEIIKAGGPEPGSFSTDITDSEKVKETVNEIVRKFGRIEILVNNAGIHFNGTLELSEKDFKKMLETNLTAQFVMLKEVIPVMKKQQSGYIFNVASRSAKVGFAGSGGYCASKFGLLGLSESLYRELTPQGIKVTALCPAWVNTSMAQEAGTPLEPEEMIQSDDLFKTILWLLQLSPGACVKEVVITNPKSL
jgi:NAD(P)-dependent dehydrogenase (short-subunit alcohol dehydrogenase family)